MPVPEEAVGRWIWVTRGRGGVPAESVKLFHKPPKYRWNEKTGTVIWLDPVDNLLQPETIYMDATKFYSWFGFLPEEGECRLFKVGMKLHTD